MAIDPRKYIISDCNKSTSASIANTSSRKDFFGALGKIGDLEVGGKAAHITSGLRSIEGVSNAIRDGEGGPPGLLGVGSVLGGSVDNGANWVLDNVGIAPSAVQAAKGFNPRITNVAVDQAQSIFTKVKQGNFKLEDFPSAVSDFNNLDTLLGGIYTPQETAVKEEHRCFATHYASALATRYSPKFKFMFMVEFIFSEAYIRRMSWTDIDRNTAFLVKTSTRPNMRFEYEDVNMYNFRTKVIKRGEYDPMTMVFHDDMQNNVAGFYHKYLEEISPITRFEGDKALFEESGMVDTTTRSTMNAASIGSLDENTKTIFSEIRLYHLYDFGNYVNRYTFHNPKITEVQFDDLDMSSSDAPQTTMIFIYDALRFESGIPIKGDTSMNIHNLTNFGNLPIIPNATEEIPPKPDLLDEEGDTSIFGNEQIIS